MKKPLRLKIIDAANSYTPLTLDTEEVQELVAAMARAQRNRVSSSPSHSNHPAPASDYWCVRIPT